MSKTPQTSTTEWQWRRREVIIRDDYECQNSECDAKGGPRGDTQLTVHHMVPESKGGSDDKDNLRTLCESCHRLAHPGGWNAHVEESGVTTETANGRIKDTGTGRYTESYPPERFIEAIRESGGRRARPTYPITLVAPMTSPTSDFGHLRRAEKSKAGRWRTRACGRFRRS